MNCDIDNIKNEHDVVVIVIYILSFFSFQQIHPSLVASFAHSWWCGSRRHHFIHITNEHERKKKKGSYNHFFP